MAAARSPPVAPLPNVTFDGNNFCEWSMMLRVCLDVSECGDTSLATLLTLLS
jgi:hypothetical protein